MTSELEPFCYLTQTSSAKNPPHGWSVHFTDGDIPLYTEDALAQAREQGRQAGLDQVLRGLRSEDDSTQLKAIIASVEALKERQQ